MADKPLPRGEIFVVDDDPAIREILSMVLSAGGYKVICFADGAALLAVARTRCPSCILLDVHIPGKSGLDILKELGGSATFHESEGRHFIRGNNGCPLAAATAHHPDACLIAESLLTQIIGAPVKERCIHGKTPSCRFQVS
jgi:CheY-like chemotaxis protein